MDVFISHSVEDTALASLLTEALKAEGLSVNSDQFIEPGGNWVQALMDGIAQASTFVALVSPRYLTSNSGGIELAAAIAGKAADNSKRIFPVLIDGATELPPVLSQYRAFVLSDPSEYPVDFRLLARLIRKSRGEHTSAENLERYADNLAQAERRMRQVNTAYLATQHLAEQIFLKNQFLSVATIAILIAVFAVAFLVNHMTNEAFVSVLSGLVGYLLGRLATPYAVKNVAERSSHDD